MKWLFLFLHVFTLSLCAQTVTQPSFLKGVSSFTVYTQVSPHEIDLALQSTLEKVLSAHGSMIYVKTTNDQFYEAMSNAMFLKLSLETRICVKMAQEYQVKEHLVLECIDRSIHKEQSSVPSRWICEKEIDFSKEGKVPLSACQHVVQDLTTQFLETYRQANAEMKEKPVFFVL